VISRAVSPASRTLTLTDVGLPLSTDTTVPLITTTARENCAFTGAMNEIQEAAIIAAVPILKIVFFIIMTREDC